MWFQIKEPAAARVLILVRVWKVFSKSPNVLGIERAVLRGVSFLPLEALFLYRIFGTRNIVQKMGTREMGQPPPDSSGEGDFFKF